jgi:hypothetical protein
MRHCLLILLSTLLLTLSSSACIDPPTAISVSYVLDSSECEMLIEVSNLRMMGGAPNQFCSCGINDQISNLGTIQYIAFVDSVTDVPVLGFEQFAIDLEANDSWATVDEDYDWNGFVSLVNESGLVAGQAVKLWIRLDLFDQVDYDGVIFDPCDDLKFLLNPEIVQGAIGTDEWNDAEGQLALDHNGIAYFWDSEIGLTLVEEGGLSYYDDIIESFYLSLTDERIEGLSIYPNPARDLLHIQSKGARPIRVSIYDAQGLRVFSGAIPDGRLDISGWNKGLYTLQSEDNEAPFIHRFVKD